MKRLIPSLFILLTALAFAQSVEAPTLSTRFHEFATTAALQADMAERIGARDMEMYLLGRASAFRQAAELASAWGETN